MAAAHSSSQPFEFATLEGPVDKPLPRYLPLHRVLAILTTYATAGADSLPHSGLRGRSRQRCASSARRTAARRTCASQVWRIWPLFELFLDNSALVWLFCRDFQSSLEILSHFLGDFQSFSLEIFSRFLWRFSLRFMEIFSKVYGDFQSFLWIFSVVLWRFSSLICEFLGREPSGRQESGPPLRQRGGSS